MPLGKKADAGDYVDDFKKSKAPQFKGKSQKKRRQMAIAAYLSNKNELKKAVREIIREETTIDRYITVLSVIDGKRNLDSDQIRMIFSGDVHGTFYIYTNEEGEYENEKEITREEALEYIKYYNARLKGDSNTEERLGAKLGVLGIESELRFNHGEIKGDPTVFSKNENYADGKEKEIVDDILSGLN